jgi:hypothetical protein
MLGSLPIRSRAGSRAVRKQRSLRLESLENRVMLSHPTVTAVNVASTQWTSSFVSFLQSHSLGVGGYAIPVGTNQHQTLPWNNVDQICITFSEDVVVTAADLSVSGVNTTARAFSGFSYDPNTCTATWTLAAPITKDKLMLDLDADGMAPAKSVATAEVLDGAWIDSQNTFPSGNGQGGSDFEFRFHALPGDANASNGVSTPDGLFVRQAIGKNAGDTGYNIRYDIDGSGGITTDDFNAVCAQLGSLLPSGNPAGMTDDAPTTSGISDVSVATGTTDHVLALTDFFADAETASADLAYSIVQNSNPSMFNSLNINASKELDLSFVTSAHGDAALTVRATDPTGLFVDTTLNVHVSDAPFFADFSCINDLGDYWTFTGTIGDNDDPVAGDVITFGGVLESYHLSAVAGIDGAFSLTIELVGLQSGTATAQTKDPHGVLSEVAEDIVVVI